MLNFNNSMKRLKLLSYIGILVILFNSCNDDFFSHQPEFYGEENVFSNVALAEGVVNSLLAARTFSNEFDKPSVLQILGGDVTSFSSSLIGYANGNIATNDAMVNGIWTKAYEQIRTANQFVENVVPRTDWGQDRDRLLGEVYFMRAYYNLELLNLFGGKGYGIPLIYKAQAINDNNVFVDRSSFVQSRDSIYADLDRAISLLPEPSSTNGNRPNKGIAMAYKSRLALYAASPINNLENDLSLWQFAAQCARDVIDAAYYKLHTSYDNIFRENNPELIFFFESNLQVRAHYTDEIIQPSANRGQALITPTQNLVDCYEVLENNGTRAVPFNWDNPIHAANPYANRDPRYAISVLFHGSTWVDGNGNPRLIDVSPGGIDMTANVNNATRTGYYIRKQADPRFFQRANNGEGLISVFNYIELRYAEILLNYVEAELTLGNIAEAVTYINQIRERANMPSIAAADFNWDRYVNERRVELAFEGQRFFDVRRWMVAAEVFNTVYRGVNVTLDESGKAIYTLKEVNTRVYPERMDLFPIPQADFDILRAIYPDFQQNPDW